MRRYPFKKLIAFVLVLCMALTALASCTSEPEASTPESTPEQTPEQVELFWTYNTPNVAMMSVAMFLIMSHVRIPEHSLSAKWLANLTSCGFGMYMIHYYFVYLGYEAGIWLHVPAPLRIPFSALIILVCSWSIVAFVKKLFGHKVDYLLG